MRINRTFITILSLTVILSSPAKADIRTNPFEGVEMATINLNGKEIEFPVGDKDRRDKIYYLKKAMNGDKEAREVFMEGKKEMWFFVGKENPLWLKVTSDKVELIDPNKKKEKHGQT